MRRGRYSCSTARRPRALRMSAGRFAGKKTTLPYERIAVNADGTTGAQINAQPTQLRRKLSLQPPITPLYPSCQPSSAPRGDI